MSETVNAPTSAPVVEKQETVGQQQPIQIDKFASKFAALSRKEQEIAKREKEISMTAKQREEEYANKLKELQEKQSKYAPYEELETSISTDKKRALNWLLSKGISAGELTELLVEEMNPDPEVRMKRELDSRVNSTAAELKKEIDELKKQLSQEKENKLKEEQDSVQKQHEQVISNVKKQLSDFVDKNNNDYTLIKQYDNVDLVYDLMQTHYEQQVAAGVHDSDIKLLSYKEACDKVEEHLAEQVKAVYEAKWAKKQSPETEVKTPEGQQTTQTLSNTLSTEVPGEVERTLSDEERKKAAAKMLKWID